MRSAVCKVSPACRTSVIANPPDRIEVSRQASACLQRSHGSRRLSAKKSLPWCGNYVSKHSLLKQPITGIPVPSKLAIKNHGTAPLLLIVLALLTIIFWGNVFRFSPGLIDRTYDTTSDGVVIGRLARAAAEGFTSGNADLGVNGDPMGRIGGYELFQNQVRYYEDPKSINALHLEWFPYASQFGLQGIIFSAIDLINPLPRPWRLSFYHFLAALFCAGMLVWIAEILRRRFGWAAFCGFLIPLALEPMLTALAPSIYWVAGTWFAPMAIAMLLADEENPGRRYGLIAAAFVCFLVKCLSGYEFIPTIILAAAVGCLLGVKESPDRLSRMLGNMAWIAGAGVAGFVVALVVHGAKVGGFANIASRAAIRIMGDAPTLAEEIFLGKFATIQSVLLRYLEGNDVTLTKNFAIPLAFLVLVAVLSLLDKKIIWYLGDDRRRLQILSLAFLASIAAPLSWFVLAKGHSFVHPSINFILWYVPTIPLGGAAAGVALALSIENRRLWRAADAARRAITIGIPALIVLSTAGIWLADRTIQTQGTWVLSVHSKAMPLFESEDLGIEFRMSDLWFTVQYDCRVAASVTGFFLHAYEGGVVTKYDFDLRDKKIYEKKNRCFYAQAKADRPFSRIDFGALSKGSTLWEHDVSIVIPDSFTLEQVTDAEWDRGVNRTSGTELLVLDDNFPRLFLRKGDRLQLASSGQRTIAGISTVGPFKWLRIDAPVSSADVGDAPIKIIRQ